MVQRTVPVPVTAPGETEEELGPETPHGAQNLQADIRAPSGFVACRQQRVRVAPVQQRYGCSP